MVFMEEMFYLDPLDSAFLIGLSFDNSPCDAGCKFLLYFFVLIIFLIILAVFKKIIL